MKWWKAVGLHKKIFSFPLKSLMVFQILLFSSVVDIQDQYACIKRYTINHNKSQVIQLNNTKPDTGHYLNELHLNNPQRFGHLGIIRDNHTAYCTGEVVQVRIATFRKALNAMRSVGLHCMNSLNSKFILHLIRVYVTSRFEYGLDVVRLTSKTCSSLHLSTSAC